MIGRSPNDHTLARSHDLLQDLLTGVSADPNVTRHDVILQGLLEIVA